MSKQTVVIRRNCQHENCVRDATIGTYSWEPGETDINLNRPVRVWCGEHKPRLHRDQSLRNVKLRRE